ncbi:hypothetical protein KRV43_11520 [Staphylococcus xylosus]|uniref:hypothetical protein n=1 Tax=Staphylococcus xylosus TaxID=1288 RepID=UPI000B28358F|nr:hypothetical protein [Staphylococcus xylosus]MBO3075859.1 hypothetical protein [Staphylococcus xylosus]MBV5141358.1 hypothetical protein [Staphylococcus xylosus]MBW3126585.1 hypothetical protein [Staphylococcus xylosus]MEB8103784.1 hypothetical protein [Staphylococcus xylosus]
MSMFILLLCIVVVVNWSLLSLNYSKKKKTFLLITGMIFTLLLIILSLKELF